MTEQHPLTDEIIDELQGEQVGDEDRNMRAAADWQLEQVLEWIQNNIQNEDSKWYYLYDDQIEDLRKAMRPQEDNNE